MTAGQHCLRFASSSVSCFTPTLGALKPSRLGNILKLMGSICCEPRRVPLRPMNPAHTHSEVTQVIWFESISLARRTGTQHTSSRPGKQSDMKKPNRKLVSVIECFPRAHHDSLPEDICCLLLTLDKSRWHRTANLRSALQLYNMLQVARMLLVLTW